MKSSTIHLMWRISTLKIKFHGYWESFFDWSQHETLLITNSWRSLNELHPCDKSHLVNAVWRTLSSLLHAITCRRYDAGTQVHTRWGGTTLAIWLSLLLTFISCRLVCSRVTAVIYWNIFPQVLWTYLIFIFFFKFST